MPALPAAAARVAAAWLQLPGGGLPTGTGPTAIPRSLPCRRSMRAWVAAGDSLGVPVCAAVVALDGDGDVVELRQVYAGSSAFNSTGGSGGGGTTPPTPTPTPPTPPAQTNQTGVSVAPANPANFILAAARMNLKAVSCPAYNGTAWGFYGTDAK